MPQTGNAVLPYTIKHRVEQHRCLHRRGTVGAQRPVALPGSTGLTRVHYMRFGSVLLAVKSSGRIPVELQKSRRVAFARAAQPIGAALSTLQVDGHLVVCVGDNHRTVLHAETHPTFVFAVAVVVVVAAVVEYSATHTVAFRIDVGAAFFIASPVVLGAPA